VTIYKDNQNVCVFFQRQLKLTCALLSVWKEWQNIFGTTNCLQILLIILLENINETKQTELAAFTLTSSKGISNSNYWLSIYIYLKISKSYEYFFLILIFLKVAGRIEPSYGPRVWDPCFRTCCFALFGDIDFWSHGLQQCFSTFFKSRNLWNIIQWTYVDTQNSAINKTSGFRGTQDENTGIQQ